MKIIKLNAIDSTNSFLKDLAQNSTLKCFTTVVTNNQQKGRGQMNSTWLSEPFKNLTFSTLIANIQINIDKARYINFAASLAIFDVLKSYSIKELSIKWPNDILSENKKICGVLIENTFVGNKIKNSIIGIGLNVNQTNFNELTNVTSIKCETNKEANLNELLDDLLKNLEVKYSAIKNGNFKKLEIEYLNQLYKYNQKTDFTTSTGKTFTGKITGIANNGNLQITLPNNEIKSFGIKEISFAK